MDTYRISPYRSVTIPGPRIDVLVVCRDHDEWYGCLFVADVPGRLYGPYAREAIIQGVLTRAARRVWKQAASCP